MIQQYALAMECEISDDGSINLAAFFDSFVIDKARIGWLLRHFASVILQLESLCISGESTVSEIDLATEYDQEIFWSWNKECPEAPDTCVHQIIEEQALRTPRLPAIHAHDRNLDYGELDRLSSEVAYNLIGMNVGPGVKVPICMEKSSTMMVALLAILKAGAAYVPLDPSYPSSRIKHILGEVEAGIVLVSEITASRFDGIAYITVVSVERIISQYRRFSGPSVRRTLPRVSPSEVAYVIFTSGSTGTPKGVVMEHSALSTTVISEGKTFSYRQGLRVLLYTNIIFDTSIAEIFTTLAHGGCVCIPSESDRMNRLVETINEMEVELVHLTPTVVSLMDLKQIPNLKTLVVGGEPLTHADVQNSSDAGFHMINAYGPTETCVDVIINTAVTPDSNPNIGHPRTCCAWILELDNSDRLAPLGCVGELAISGPTLARGYLKDEEKTNASFLENLSWMRHGRSRAYKTGDLARFNGDGSILYLGRRDTQVKVNGQRIELGEIESQIRQLGRDLQVAVEYLPEGKRSILVAFLVDETATPYPTSEFVVSSLSDRFARFLQEIKTRLKEFLPVYMIPSLFIPISYLPVGMSGKLDRRRLQEAFSCLSEDEIRGHRFQFAGEKSLPTTETEEMLQGLWAKVLEISDPSTIGLDDGFFDLGGDSITAIQLVAAVRRKGFLLTVADVFASSKLRQMSGAVLQKEHCSNSKSVDLQVPLPPPPFTLLPDTKNCGTRLDQISAEISTERISIQDAYPATAIQLACVIEGQKWHRSWYSWFTLEIEGALDSERLRHACQSVVDHHAILRTVFCMDGRLGLQVVLEKNTIDFEARQDTKSDHDLILSMCDNTGPVAFGKHMVKFRLLSLDQTTHRLAVGLSHAQYDGMCLALILGDIQTAYLHQPLPTRPSYSIFIDYALKANSEDAELFWRTTLQGFTMTNLVSRRLPSDRYHLQSREVRDIYPPSSSGANGATFSTILKAAWSLVLARYCSRSDITFGNLISGRNAPIEGIEEMIGPCMNILPTPVRLDQDWSYNDLLSHLLAQQLAMIPYETMAYADIVEKCTQWPRSTRFGSVVQHQNLPAPVQHNSGPGEPTWETAGPISYPGLCDEVDCWVCSVPHGDHVTIDLRHNDQILPSSIASVLLDSLCTIVMDIFENTDRNIMSAISTVGTPISPLLLPILANTTDTTAILENVETALNSQVLLTLRDAWQETLVGDAAVAEMQDATHDMDANFFDMGGDSVAAAQLATSCARQQLGISIQDIFDYPTIRLQALLASGVLERARPVEREGHNVTFWEG